MVGVLLTVTFWLGRCAVQAWFPPDAPPGVKTVRFWKVTLVVSCLGRVELWTVHQVGEAVRMIVSYTNSFHLALLSSMRIPW